MCLRARRLSFVAFAAPLLAVCAFVPARAADNGQWSLFPSKNGEITLNRSLFEPTLKPGVITRDSVTITNKTSRAIRLNLYAADAFNTTQGGFALRHSYDPKLGVGAWIHLPVDQITIPPRTQANVPFVIATPGNAPPGDHAGGIVAENTQPVLSKRGALSVRALYAVAVRVYARVRGPLHPTLAITNFRIKGHPGFVGSLGGNIDADVEYTLVNTGNTRLHASGLLTVAPLVGSPRRLTATTPFELLPGGRVTEHQEVQDIAPWGRLSATLALQSEAGSTHSSTTTWVVPWLTVLLLVALATALVVWRRRRAVSGGESGVAPVEDDNVPERAEAASGTN